MRVLIDTNIIISAALFPNGRAAKAFRKALTAPYQPVVSDYIVDELRRVFSQKWPDKVDALEVFLRDALSVIELIATPQSALSTEGALRDANDRPILRAALHAKVDVIITGDRDFLESSIQNPRIVSVPQFLDGYGG